MHLFSVSWIASIWSNEKVRYLLTGAVNTLLSYAIGAILFYLLIDHMHYGFIMVVGTIICITVSFANHKMFVFRTKGNLVREYLRFYVVYAIPICFSFVAFPICYEFIGMNPYVAQAFITAITVLASYVGHKRFSFKSD